MAKVSKRMRSAMDAVGRDRVSLDEAVRLVRKAATAKFDETIELSVNLGVDVRHSDQQVRGKAQLPHGNGKEVKVAVFARGDKADDAKKAGADIVGAEDLADQIKGGNIEFTRCIASPDMMGIVGQLGRILGPRNLMPNPRLGTVTPDVAAAVKAAKGGEITFRTEKAGIVHCFVGRASFSERHLIDNARAALEAIQAARPSGAKGAFIEGIAMSSTMGPGVKVLLDFS